MIRIIIDGLWLCFGMIFAIGELLIDFIAVEDVDLKYVKTFEKHPGGAPANMVVGLRRLGVPSALISKVGRDVFGEFLVEELEREGVDTRYISHDEENPTGVVFVQLREAKPNFLLFEKTAYFNLRMEDVNLEFMDSAELLHFGGVLLAREPSRTTCLEVVRMARERGIPISFDANIRLHLWKGRIGELVEYIRRALELADVVKLGDGEKRFLEENGVNLGDLDLKLIAVTMGEKGSTLIHGGREITTPPYPVKAVDSTGAGDAYMAALLAALYSMRKLGDLSLNDGELRLVGRFANVVAAISTTKRGAWSVPTLSQLEEIGEIKPIVDGLRRRGG